MNTLRTFIGAIAATAVLSACNGGSTSSSIPGLGGNNGYFRFVNGSADAGAVDVYVDGQKINTNPVAYGQITAYNAFSAGSHTIAINGAGTTTAIAGVPQSAVSQSINGGQYASLVLAGEEHPKASQDTINLLKFSDQVYSTPSGGAAVNIHNAAPVVAAQSQSVQFGYYFINTPTTTGTLGASAGVGGLTQPTGIPGTALNASTQVGFYAVNPQTYTVTPSQIDPTGCAQNTLPCNSGNLSLYLIDGPASSTTPAAGPYPQGVSATSTAGFVGIFDANGT